jgi:hypothetical protein
MRVNHRAKCAKSAGGTGTDRGHLSTVNLRMLGRLCMQACSEERRAQRFPQQRCKATGNIADRSQTFSDGKMENLGKWSYKHVERSRARMRQRHCRAPGGISHETPISKNRTSDTAAQDTDIKTDSQVSLVCTYCAHDRTAPRGWLAVCERGNPA